MKIISVCELTVLANLVNEVNGKNYYSLTVFDKSSGEAGTLKCTEDVYRGVVCGKENTLVCEYNDKYNSYRAVVIDKASDKGK